MQRGAYPQYVGEWLFDNKLKGIIDSDLNCSYENEARGRISLGEGEYGQIGNFNYLDEPNYGFNVGYKVNYSENEYEMFSRPRKKKANIKTRFQDNLKGDSESNADFGFAFTLRGFFHDKENSDGVFVNTRFDSTRVKIEEEITIIDLNTRRS